MMDIIKKNLLSIICGVVALAAVGASFIPMGSYQETQKATLDAGVKLYQEREHLRTQGRNKPVLNLENANAEPLGRFPNDATIEKAEAAKAQFAADADKILKAAKDMNEHKLLVPG